MSGQKTAMDSGVHSGALHVRSTGAGERASGQASLLSRKMDDARKGPGAQISSTSKPPWQDTDADAQYQFRLTRWRSPTRPGSLRGALGAMDSDMPKPHAGGTLPLHLNGGR